MRILLVISLVAALAAAGAVTGWSDTPPPPRHEREDVVRLHMHENFDLLRAIERLLIRGRLEDARGLARAIAEVPDPPAHGPWAAHVVAVRDRAAALGQATTVDRACRAEAQLAAACAGCHTDAAAIALFQTVPPAPPDLPTLPARMLRHRWAADRMWEGLVGAADGPWTAALEVLAATPLAMSDHRAAAARRLQQLAADARAHRGLDELPARAAVYGELLATCAGCHAAPTPAARLPR